MAPVKRRPNSKQEYKSFNASILYESSKTNTNFALYDVLHFEAKKKRDFLAAKGSVAVR